MTKRSVAIIGTNGIPAQYGGFETLAENLVHHLIDKNHVEVYCSRPNQSFDVKEYNGAKLIYLPLRANGWQSFLYDFFSTLRAFFLSDVILILGPACGLVIPVNKFFGKLIITNHGGLNEWERESYSPLKRRFSWLNHYVAAKFSDVNVVDNVELQKSLRKNFGAESKVIRYGGDHVLENEEVNYSNKYPFCESEYFVCVARAQIDNNLHILLEAFESMPHKTLVIVSNWSVSQYARELRSFYQKHKNINMLDAIYNQSELNFVRRKAFCYIHSHSRCGTAPSLVEAMTLGLPVVSFDCATNRETTQNCALFFQDAKSLVSALTGLEGEKIVNLKNNLSLIAQNNFLWSSIAQQYSDNMVRNDD
jgi:glycosyltransferase involved in cell wall biosynthesis